jgi:hypothetical protein
MEEGADRALNFETIYPAMMSGNRMTMIESEKGKM